MKKGQVTGGTEIYYSAIAFIIVVVLFYGLFITSNTAIEAQLQSATQSVDETHTLLSVLRTPVLIEGQEMDMNSFLFYALKQGKEELFEKKLKEYLSAYDWHLEVYSLDPSIDMDTIEALYKARTLNPNWDPLKEPILPLLFQARTKSFTNRYTDTRISMQTLSPYDTSRVYLIVFTRLS